MTSTTQAQKITLPVTGHSYVAFSAGTVHFVSEPIRPGQEPLSYIGASYQNRTHRLSRSFTQKEKTAKWRKGFEVLSDTGDEAIVNEILGLLLSEKIATEVK